MLVIYDLNNWRVYGEAIAVCVDDDAIHIEFEGSSNEVKLSFGEGWTKDEAVKAIEGQLFDEDPGMPISLVHIQQPFPKADPFASPVPVAPTF